MVTMYEESTVLVEYDAGIATVRINRPESLNALNPDVLQGLIIEFGKLASNTTLRSVIITGKGPKAFVAGADIRSMNDLGPRPLAEYVELGQRAMRVIETFEVPVIAAVNGFALGGGLELALACDLIVCAESAKLGQPEVNLGIIPGFGGTQRLLQRCGIGATRRLCYTGELIGASEALSIGLADKVFPDASFTEDVKKLAQLIASKAPLAVRGAKRVINRAQEAQLLGGLRVEVEEFNRLFATEDRAEGMKAFMQKREAKFTGR